MSDLNEMWAALERYQPYADKKGHGESWKRMTQKRTKDAAWTAIVTMWASPTSRLARNAVWAARAALHPAEDSERFAAQAIELINEAMEVQP